MEGCYGGIDKDRVNQGHEVQTVVTRLAGIFNGSERSILSLLPLGGLVRVLLTAVVQQRICGAWNSQFSAHVTSAPAPATLPLLPVTLRLFLSYRLLCSFFHFLQFRSLVLAFQIYSTVPPFSSPSLLHPRLLSSYFCTGFYLLLHPLSYPSNICASPSPLYLFLSTSPVLSSLD